MLIRNDLKQQSLYSNDPEKLHEYKLIRNRIRSKLKKEKFDYYSKKLVENGNNTKELWKTSYQILGKCKDSSPKQIVYNGSLISSPELLAETFNDIFIKKVEKVKSEIVNDIGSSPVERLMGWLTKHDSMIPPLEFKPITLTELRHYVHKLKGGRSCGLDDIDSFSLKLAAPIIENVLLHLVNLTITESCFAEG